MVIKIGRNLVFPASINASSVLRPRNFSLLVKSTIKIPFLATKPSIIIIPRPVNKLKLDFANANANKAPIIATGIENKTTNGYTNES